MLLMGTPFRFIAHFWEYGVFAYLLPAAFLVAALLQCLLFHGKKRTWLPAVVCFGGLAACEIVFQILAALATGKRNLGAAFSIQYLESFLLSVLLGFAAGLLLSLLLKSMTPLKNG